MAASGSQAGHSGTDESQPGPASGHEQGSVKKQKMTRNKGGERHKRMPSSTRSPTRSRRSGSHPPAPQNGALCDGCGSYRHGRSEVPRTNHPGGARGAAVREIATCCRLYTCTTLLRKAKSPPAALKPAGTQRKGPPQARRNPTMWMHWWKHHERQKLAHHRRR